MAFDAAFRLRFAGLANVPASGGALLAYNHVSVLDPVLVGLGADRRGRSVRFLSLSEAFDQRYVGWGLRRTRQIPLAARAGRLEGDRDGRGGDPGGLATGLSPEGTVGDGAALQPGQKGAASIALLTGAPVIPVGDLGRAGRWGKRGLTSARPFDRPWPSRSAPRSSPSGTSDRVPTCANDRPDHEPGWRAQVDVARTRAS